MWLPFRAIKVGEYSFLLFGLEGEEKQGVGGAQL